MAKQLLDEIIDHARAEAPIECCGMVASRDGAAVRVYRATKAAASPLRYEIDGAEQATVRAYLDAIPKLTPGAARSAAASILANEAQHVSVLRRNLGLDPIPSAFVTARE